MELKNANASNRSDGEKEGITVMRRLIQASIALVLLTYANLGHAQQKKVELSSTKRDIVASFKANLPLKDGKNHDALTNRFECLWDLKQQKNGIFYYVQNSQENWLFVTRFFGELYQAKPRIHRNAGNTNESIFYGVGSVPSYAAYCANPAITLLTIPTFFASLSIR